MGEEVPAAAISSDQPPYPRAPIAEAILDVRVPALPAESLELLAAFADPAYPQRQESRLLDAQIEHNALGVVTRGSQQLNGYRHTSADGHYVAQFRTDGFTFSRMAPYDRWDTFYAEATRMLRLYEQACSPPLLTRLALRYINQISVPPGQIPVDEYLRTRPEIADDMPNTTTGFFLTMDLPLPDHDAKCRIIETILPPLLPPNPSGSQTRLVLDIDVYKEVAVSPSADDHLETLNASFVMLRHAKNMVFEKSITDKTRRLFT